MEIKNRIKSLLQEAEIYRSQGLFDESKKRYNNAAELIQKNEQIKNKKDLIDSISKKIHSIDDLIEKINKSPSSPQMSSKVQDVIKNKFAFSDDKDEAALEGAIALAKFGQFEGAIKEFNELLKKDAFRIVAAKNIIRCHLALNLTEDAIRQYEQWLKSGLFPAEDLGKVRFFLENVLEKKGHPVTLPHGEEHAEENIAGYDFEPSQMAEDEFLDISSVTITLNDASGGGKIIEFDVSFQSGNVISLLISDKEKELIENLKVGVTLNDIQFYSPIAIFKGKGIVSAKTKIESGPKRGDYSLDIKIVSK